MKALILLLAAVACVSVNSVPVGDFFPFGLEHGDQSLPESDDGATDAVELDADFVFYGKKRRTVYVNNNGLISFINPVTFVSPVSLPLDNSNEDIFELIAPFWSDVDTRGTGTVYYRQTYSPILLAIAAYEIQTNFEEDFVPSLLFVATWDRVGYYNERTDLTNTFQCVLATDNQTKSFVTFLYADGLMQWTSSHRTQGAQVGFNAGFGGNHLALPTSHTEYVLNITRTSDIGRPGVWLFKVDGASIWLPGAVLGVESVTYSVSEDRENVTVCATVLLGELHSGINLTAVTIDLTATSSADYNETSVLLHFAPENATELHCVTVPILEDSVLEESETFGVLLTSPEEVVTLLPQMTIVTIHDNDVVSVNHFSMTPMGYEESGRVDVCAIVSQPTEKTIQVNVNSLPGNATINVDYQPRVLGSPMVFLKGTTVRCSYLTLLDDDILEGPETFLIALSSEDEDVHVTTANATVVILDNDGFLVRVGFQSSLVTVTEGNRMLDLCVELEGDIDDRVVVRLSTFSYRNTALNGSDYLDTDQYLVFPPARENHAPQCASIQILDNTAFEELESFIANLEGVRSDLNLNPRTVRVDIVDDDGVSVMFEQQEYTVLESGMRVRVCAVLTGVIETNVEVTLTTSEGTATAESDFRMAAKELTIHPGEEGRPVCIDFDILNDFGLEQEETFTISLGSSDPSVDVTQRGTATVTILDNEIAHVQFQQAPLSLSEGTHLSPYICVTLDTTPEIIVSILLSTINGKAKGGEDFVAKSEEVLEYDPHQRASCFRLEIIDDDILETEEENLLLSLDTDVERIEFRQRTLEITIIDNDVVYVSIEEAQYSIDEDISSVSVCVEIEGRSDSDVVVLLSTENGTALAGRDYIYSSVEVIFGPLEQRTCTDITIIDNNIVGLLRSKSFIVTLQSSNEKVITDMGSATVTIWDNDVATVSLQQNEYLVSEGVGDVSVCIGLELERVAEFDIIASLNTAELNQSATETADYSSHDATEVVFIAGVSEPQCIVIHIVDDAILENTESFGVLLSLPTERNDLIRPGLNSSTVTIEDNDVANVSFERSDYTVLEGNETAGVAAICVELTSDIERPITLTLSTESGTAQAEVDYIEISTSLEFEPLGSQLQCVDVVILNDVICDSEAVKSFRVLLDTTDTSINIASDSARVDILDDDTVYVRLGDTAITVVENETMTEVCAILTGEYEGSVQVVLVAAPMTTQVDDYLPSEPISLEFLGNEKRKCAMVIINDDDIVENRESLSVSLSSETDCARITGEPAIVTIIDNDYVIVGLNSTEYSVNEGEESATVCVELSGRIERREPIQVTLSTKAGTAQAGRDYSEHSATLEFAMSDGVTKCTDILLIDDSILEDQDDFSVYMNATNPADDAVRIAPGSMMSTVTILDNDIVTVGVQNELYTVDESDGQLPVCVTLTGEIERDVQVTFHTEAGTALGEEQDFHSFSEDIVFEPGSEHEPWCTNISLVDDNAVEAVEVFFVSLVTSDMGVVLDPENATISVTDGDVVCEADKTSSARGTYDWKETLPNTSAEEKCEFGEGGTARRFCNVKGNWEKPDLTECYADTADLFDEILKNGFSRETMELLALAVAQALETRDYNAEYLEVIAIIFDQFAVQVEAKNITVDEELFGFTLTILDGIQNWGDVEVLQEQSSSIVESFEVISVGLARNENITEPVLFHGDNMLFKAEKEATEELNESGKDFSFDITTNGTLKVTMKEFNSTLLTEDTIAKISFPPSLFENLKNSQASILLSLYDSPVLFPLAKDSPHGDEIKSPVIAASVADEIIADLKDPIIIVLRLLNGTYSAHRCVSWDFQAADGKGNWTTEGCKTETVVNDTVECRCNHLTNFAVLVDIRSRMEGVSVDEENELALQTISMIGVVLSLIGLILTLIILLSFRKLRKRDNTKFRVQLCIAMVCMLVVFVTGIDRTEIFEVCVAVSVLLHYFTLVSIMWMGAEALLMFQKLIMVCVQTTTRYIVIVSLTCWLLPLPAVVVPVVLDRDYVISSDYCFISHIYVFFGAFLGPIFAVILFNMVIFLVVVCVIMKHTCRKSKDSKIAGKRKGTFRTLLSIMGVMTLFGLTWFLGAFTFKEASIIFQYLFAIFNSLQGFFIFLFFCVLAKDTRTLLLQAMGCRKKKVPITSTSVVSGRSRGDTMMKYTPTTLHSTDLEAQPQPKVLAAETPIVQNPSHRWDCVFVQQAMDKLRFQDHRSAESSFGETMPVEGKREANGCPNASSTMDETQQPSLQSKHTLPWSAESGASREQLQSSQTNTRNKFVDISLAQDDEQSPLIGRRSISMQVSRDPDGAACHSTEDSTFVLPETQC